MKRETVHRVGSPELAYMAENPRYELPVRGVFAAGEFVGPNVGRAPNAEGPNLDVVGAHF